MAFTVKSSETTSVAKKRLPARWSTIVAATVLLTLGLTPGCMASGAEGAGDPPQANTPSDALLPRGSLHGAEEMVAEQRLPVVVDALAATHAMLGEGASLTEERRELLMHRVAVMEAQRAALEEQLAQ